MKNLGRAFLLAAVVCTVPALQAEIQCNPSAVPAALRAEGLTEVVGDVVFSCTGGADEIFTGSIGLYLPVAVTNRVTDGKLEGVLVTINGGPAPGLAAVPSGSTGVALTNLSFRMPAEGVAIRVSGIRAAVAKQGIDNASPITATIALSGPMVLTRNIVTVGIPRRALLAGENATAISCGGSRIPDELTMDNLLAGTTVFSTRVTEGFASAFGVPVTGATGTRVMLRYSGIPAGTRVFVPDLVAGTLAAQPTSGGDLRLAASGGEYTAGTLLLALVSGADANGAGGTHVAVPEPGTALNGASEITVTSGAGYAVYEVVDGNPAVSESAHIPTFLGAPPTGFGLPTYAGRHTVTLAPIAAGEGSDAIPRFVEATPLLDCTAVGDCGVFPKLSVRTQQPLTFVAQAGGAKQSLFGAVENAGGGYLSWAANLLYQGATGWVNLYTEPNTNYQSGWFRVDVDPSQLAPGVYQATLVIDAGPTAGAQSVPVQLTVQAGKAPGVNAAVNAASFAPGAVVPGSIISVFGEQLAGNNVIVTFDNIPARVLYSGANQINLVVPAELRLRSSAQMLVMVDGAVSAPATVQLTAMNPAIFGNGVLNQNWTVNSGAQPAPAGSILQIFATGLPVPEDGTVMVTLGSAEITALEYAGPAPGYAGLWQVNVKIPAGTPAGLSDLSLCGVSLSSSTRVCSPAVKVGIN